MSEFTRILQAIDSGDPTATNRLLPLVYEELRDLARQRLRRERADHTLQSTALVHEAYMRLVGSNDLSPSVPWSSRGHFFAAAAEAMRRILIDHARTARAQKRGGAGRRIELDPLDHPAVDRPDQLIDLDDALREFENVDPVKAQLVKLRFFAGLTNQQAASALGISSSTADRYWAYSRAWLQTEMNKL